MRYDLGALVATNYIAEYIERVEGKRLVVVGDTTMEEIQPKLEALFADWEVGDSPTKNIAEVELAAQSDVYLVDRPGSLQSIIFAGHLAPPKSNPNEISIEAMNEVLGGSFSARINMNLREDKHWAYGAYSFFVDAQGQRPFVAYAPVQTDKTVAAMQEIRKELREIVGSRPPTATRVASSEMTVNRIVMVVCPLVIWKAPFFSGRQGAR